MRLIPTKKVLFGIPKTFFLPDWAGIILWYLVGWILHKEGKDVLGEFFIV